MQTQKKFEMDYQEFIQDTLQRFKQRQKELGYTDVYMAQRLEMKSSQNYANIISGKVSLRLEDCLSIMQVLGIEDIFVVKSKKNEFIDFLREMVEKRDELEQMAELMQRTSTAIKQAFQKVGESHEEEREGRIERVSMRATAEEKALIKAYAENQDLSYIDAFLKLIQESQK